jgi:DNA-binding NtrC family response regulator
MREHILVVDDERQLLTAIHATLEMKGYEVSTAGNGLDAMKRLAQEKFHLMISDLRMPHMDGIELLQQAQRIDPRMPVVLLTAFGTIENAVEAMRYGARDYLLKPFSSSQLLGAVERYARKDRDPKADDFLVHQCPAMEELLERARQVAQSDATVLIQAESGTGKELLARFIHSGSPRSKGPFIALNCAAMPENLLESELFGHERGSFSGAIASKPGKFELGNGGTILLDEIAEMLPILQAKLLRVLQERVIDRVGAIRLIPVDVRVIATTNRRLTDMVAAGTFRADLYYRLNVVPLTIPSLRERKQDIPVLVDHFCKLYRRRDVQFAPETVQLLQKYDWPGNIRELENIVQRALVLGSQSLIRPEDLFWEQENQAAYSKTEARTIAEMEKKMILETLDETGGNRTRAAEILGVSARTLRNKLKEYALEQ